MKIIFLDIDGPIIPGRAILLPGNFRGLGQNFDPVAMAMLTHLIRRGPDIRFVLISTWRYTETKEFVFEKFGEYDLDQYFHKDWRTCFIEGKNRHMEIMDWLNRHPEIEEFCVLDDEDMSEHFGLRMVAVKYNNGFLWEHLESILDIFRLEIM